MRGIAATLGISVSELAEQAVEHRYSARRGRRNATTTPRNGPEPLGTSRKDVQPPAEHSAPHREMRGSQRHTKERA
jgi:hypothetical protein